MRYSKCLALTCIDALCPIRQSSDDPHNVQYLLSLLRDDNNSQHPSAGLTESHVAAEEYRNRDPRVQSRLTKPAPSTQSQPQERPQPNETEVAKPSPVDKRHMTVSQALPILRQLARDARFLREMMRLKREQDQTEREVAAERKMKVSELRQESQKAQNKEGHGHGHGDERVKALRHALLTFDYEMLEKWDAMATQQQQRLQEVSC